MGLLCLSLARDAAELQLQGATSHTLWLCMQRKTIAARGCTCIIVGWMTASASSAQMLSSWPPCSGMAQGTTASPLPLWWHPLPLPLLRRPLPLPLPPLLLYMPASGAAATLHICCHTG